MKIALAGAENCDASYLAQIRQATQLPLIEPAEFPVYTHVLYLDAQGLSLQKNSLGKDKQQPTRVDFLDAGLQYRRNSFGKHQGLAKAVGLNKHEPMSVLDATAGLGRDAFILASLGCQVTLVEQSPIIYSLLFDGLQRAELAEEVETNNIISRLTLHHAGARDWFIGIQQNEHNRPDVIYLDPMFPPRSKQAKVKKDIALLQEVLGFDEDSGELIELALACAKHRVVVKKPGAKPSKSGRKPSFVVPGKTAHFEVFAS